MMDGCKLCRICLGKDAQINIYKTKSFHNTSYSLESMINVLFSFKVYENDGLPNNLCHKCLTDITASYKLKCLAEESNEKLSKQLAVYDVCKIEEGILTLKDTDSVFKVESQTWEDVEIDPGNKSELDFPDDVNDDECFGIADTTDIKLDIEIDKDAIKNGTDGTHKEHNKHLDVKKQSRKNKTRSKKKTSKVGIVNTREDDNKYVDVKNERQNKKKSKFKMLAPTECDICKIVVKDIKQHKEIHSPNRKVYQCESCPKVFLSARSRSRHFDRTHLGVRYFCPICKKFYATDAGQHNGLVHNNNQTRFECAHCDRKYSLKGKLVAHMNSHFDYRKYPCEVCGKKFKTPTRARVHKRSVHDKEKKFVCHYCSRAFFAVGPLNSHLRSHTKEGFTCPECGKMFFSKPKLNDHRKLHGNKEFSCPMCDKQFHTAGNMKLHIISHTKEKNYPCKYCDIRFGRSDHRNRHEKTAHEWKIQ